MTTTESYDSIITHCPLASAEVECPKLVGDLVLARESSGEVFIGVEPHESDSSNQRINMIMRSAIKYVRKHPCPDCPNSVTAEN